MFLNAVFTGQDTLDGRTGVSSGVRHVENSPDRGGVPGAAARSSLTMRVRTLSVSWCFLLCCVLFHAPPAYACDVPVFRWALERWEPDPYQVIIFHDGGPGERAEAIVDRLEADTLANIAVDLVDVAAHRDEQMRALWEHQSSSVLPWMVVRYPKASRIEEVVWSGALTDDAVRALLDSPKRREIAQRLLDDEDAAVWLLLESGDAEKDGAAARLLQAEISRMADTLELPQSAVGTAYSGWNTPEPPDLPITFSLVRVSRADPAERMFVEMLLHSEPDLTSFAEPIAFPIFGQGRMLYALVGAGINAENISDACTFLVEACTCQVKAQSPGTDVLMSVDWDASLKDRFVTDLALVPFAGLAETTDPVMSDQPGPGAAPGARSTSLLRNIVIVVTVQIVIVAAAAITLIARKRSASRR